jgi:hypothetical protein
MSNFVDGIGEWSSGPQAVGGAVGPGEDAEHAPHLLRLGIEIRSMRAWRVWASATIAACLAWPSTLHIVA